jgi:hypothetical protein
VDQTFIGSDYVGFTTTAGAVKARAGRLAKIVILSTITGSITIYDNPSAASGALLYVSPAAPTVGTVLPIDVPARAGMWCVPGTGGAFNVIFS